MKELIHLKQPIPMVSYKSLFNGRNRGRQKTDNLLSKIYLQWENVPTLDCMALADRLASNSLLEGLVYGHNAAMKSIGIASQRQI